MTQPSDSFYINPESQPSCELIPHWKLMSAGWKELETFRHFLDISNSSSMHTNISYPGSFSEVRTVPRALSPDCKVAAMYRDRCASLAKSDPLLKSWKCQELKGAWYAEVLASSAWVPGSPGSTAYFICKAPLVLRKRREERTFLLESYKLCHASQG